MKRQKLEEERSVFMEKVRKDNELMAEQERDLEDAETKKARGRRVPSTKKRNRSDKERGMTTISG